jgi:Uma2 family endonuclease
MSTPVKQPTIEKREGIIIPWQAPKVEHTTTPKTGKIIKFYTPTEYLTMEEQAVEKHEYYLGEIRLMTGATAKHNRIAFNTAKIIDQALETSPCQTFVSDLRLQVSDAGLFTYPDVMVVCGELQYVADREDTITNPIVIVEVLSESTADHDRGEKFRRYRQLASLRAYVLIEQAQVSVEYFRKEEENTWVLETLEALDDTLTLQALGVEIPLTKIYHKVEWSQ